MKNLLTKFANQVLSYDEMKSIKGGTDYLCCCAYGPEFVVSAASYADAVEGATGGCGVAGAGFGGCSGPR